MKPDFVKNDFLPDLTLPACKPDKRFALQPAWRRIWPVALTAALALTGCAGSPSQFIPESTNAKQIYNLFLIVYGLAAIVFVVVEGVLIYVIVRYGRRQGKGLPRQIEGNARLEVAWTLVPAVMLVMVYVLSMQTLRLLTTQPGPAVSDRPDAPLHLRVVGHQWWWEFAYPELKIVTATEIHVPVNTNVNIDIEAADVIHSFWVPQLGGKTDAIPGRVNHMWFRVTQAGVYHGQCAEFCGAEHAGMQLRVVAESAEAFQAWVKAQQAPLPSLTGQAAEGAEAFAKGPCIGCHTISGTKAIGEMGPNLTHFASRQVFAGALYDNSPENLAHWLADPQAMKPYNLMPNLHLAPEKIDALVAYLESLK